MRSEGGGTVEQAAGAALLLDASERHTCISRRMNSIIQLFGWAGETGR
jgi:hypothetical protein